MLLHFTKMQALGNDFVVIDAVRQAVRLTDRQARFLADRHFGVGCDQILLVEPAQTADADFFYRILNADGSEAGQCGNGARCFARFVRDKGLTDKSEIRVTTLGGPLRMIALDGNRVAVDMGEPCFEPGRIPFSAPRQLPTYILDIDGASLEMSVLALGNPHAVQIVENVDTAPVLEQGPAIERHPSFPERVNAGYLQVVGTGHARVRVYERGVGETLACGSGACAAVVAGRRLDLLQETVTVDLPGGSLQVTWPGPGAQVVMTGPAESVYEGEIELN